MKIKNKLEKVLLKYNGTQKTQDNIDDFFKKEIKMLKKR